MLLNQVIRVLHKVTLDPPTAVYAVAKAAQLTLFPNPTQNQLQIQSGQSFNPDCTYKIIDATGKLIREEILGKQSTRTIIVGDLQNGMYYLQLISKDKEVSEGRFTIMR